MSGKIKVLVVEPEKPCRVQEAEDELKALQAIGTHAAILGKALYTGRLDLKAVIGEVGAC